MSVRVFVRLSCVISTYIYSFTAVTVPFIPGPGAYMRHRRRRRRRYEHLSSIAYMNEPGRALYSAYHLAV